MTEETQQLFRQATNFHKATCLLASKYTGIKDFDPERHLPFPMLFQGEDGTLVRTLFQDALADEKWVEDSDSYFTTLVVNGAFSLELHLKHLHLLIEKKKVKGHDLYNLFQDLSNWTKDNLEEIFQDISSSQPSLKQSFDALNEELGTAQQWNMQTILRESAKAYVNWRYSYEPGAKTSSFAGYGEAVFAMRIMSTQYKGKDR